MSLNIPCWFLENPDKSYAQAIAVLRTGMATVEEPELQLLITSENEDAAMADNDYTPSRLRVELALSAFLSAISGVKNIKESEARTSQYQDRFGGFSVSKAFYP